mmetsp:Transcript_27515/g.79762  ORF Transcript_27515/g.79762 Transcript_27515/m.79762 type:complete len:260 (-) Transcript_27515:423-1202(-)
MVYSSRRSSRTTRSASTKITRCKSRGKMTSKNKILWAQIKRCLSPRIPKWAPVSSRSQDGHLKETNSKVMFKPSAKRGMEALKSGDMKRSKNQNRTGHRVVRRTEAIMILNSFSYKWPDATLKMWIVGQLPSKEALKEPCLLRARRPEARPTAALSKRSPAFRFGRRANSSAALGNKNRLISTEVTSPSGSAVSTRKSANVSFEMPGLARRPTSAKRPSRAKYPKFFITILSPSTVSPSMSSSCSPGRGLPLCCALPST